MPTRASGIDKKELAYFSRQIASLLTAGIPVIDALETLEADSKPRLRAILRAVRASLGNGLNLGEALALHLKRSITVTWPWCGLVRRRVSLALR